MGCGKRNFGPDWIHIDGGNHDHLDYNDVRKLDFANDSVDLIYCSHLLEYFDRSEITEVLKEYKRVLRKGGILRIAVPDFEQMAKLYVEKNYGLHNFLGPLYGRMQMKDSFIYHKTTYDFSELKSTLESSGFSNVDRYDWRKTEHSQFDDHSQAYLPHMDKERGTLISLNVQCEK